MNCPQRTDSAAELTATGVRQVNSEELLLLLHDTAPTAINIHYLMKIALYVT